jgi:uncharacterized RDD family membrane protein YckC
MTASKIVSATPASLWLRLLAAVYDLLPLLALWFVAAVLALTLSVGALDIHRLGDKILVQALTCTVTAAYFIVSWMRGGQTIGMKPWRLRVVCNDGTSPDLAHAALRFCVALLSLAAAGLGFWWALFDAQGRSWHDIAAGTLVVRMERVQG